MSSWNEGSSAKQRFNFDHLLDRKGTNCVKWDELEEQYGASDLYSLWVADMDFEAPPEVTLALTRRALHPAYGYTFAGEGYYQSIIDWFARRHHLTIATEDILPVPGVVAALSFVVEALTEPGDRILINSPVYRPLFNVVKSMDRVVADAHLLRDGNRYDLDFEGIEAQFAQGVAAYFLCSPHNPVGRVWSREDLVRLVDLCDRYHVKLISDEIHSDLALNGNVHTSILGVSEKAREFSVLLAAPSKTFNVAGIKSSFILAQTPALRQAIQKVLSRYHADLDLFGYLICETAYNHGEEWLDELLVYLSGNAGFVCDFVEKRLPRVKAYIPEGTYLMWLDFSDYGLTQDQLMEKIQHEARLALNSGTDYGKLGAGFVRLNIGTPRAYLAQALEQLAAAFS